MISDLAGVIIWTDKLNRLKSFYQDVLGLPLRSSQPGFVAFQIGGTRISVGSHSKVHGSTKEPYRIMINLGTTNIHTTYRRLRAAGVEFVREPEQEHWGGWVATFEDPDGNLLQLLQQP